MKYNNYSEPVELRMNRLNLGEELPTLDTFITSAKGYLSFMGIDTTNKVVFYKRSRNGESVLGVQLLDGSIENLDNYVVFDHYATNSGNSYMCQCKMYSEGKASPKANEFATYAIDSITTFFSVTELSLRDHNEEHRQIDCMRTMGPQKKKMDVFSKIFKRNNNKKKLG